MDNNKKRPRQTPPDDTMTNIQRVNTEPSNTIKRRRRPRLKLEDAPPVENIRDLIEIGKSVKFYKNLDTIMLWKISPYLEQLEQMIGLGSLKETVFFQVIYYLQNMHTRNKNEEYLHTVILGNPGTGKCLGINTPVMMADGSVKMVQNIEAGEYIMGDDSNPRKILSLARGKELMYKVKPIKGESYIVNESHVLSLKYSGQPRIYLSNPKNSYYVKWFDAEKCKLQTKYFGLTKQTDEQAYEQATIFKDNLGKTDNRIDIEVKKYLQLSKSIRNKLKGYRVAVDFPSKPVDFDPYILGVWLGDGTSDKPEITNTDMAIINEVGKRLEPYDLIIHQKLSADIEWYIKNKEDSQNPKCQGNQKLHNPFLDFLRDRNLIKNKHIPDEYKFNDKNVRQHVLAGLIDTDGYYNENCYEITQKRKILADDIAYVARSLGFAAYVMKVRKSCIYKGERRWGTYYKVSISGSFEELPIMIPYKQGRKRKQIKDPLVTGIKVEKLDVDDYYGFEIDGNRRFLLGDFTVTHNTTCAEIIGKIYQAMGVLSRNGPFKIAHRDDFIAEYLGQTAIKTKKLLKSCLGGVLFIDEVYSLAPTRSDRDSFAKEAIDTINGFLSEHKNDFCCIVAGYREEVFNTFFAMNKGLERRFPWVHSIDKYSSKELAQIFMKMIKEIEWTVAFTESDIVEVIDREPEIFKHAGGSIEVCISKIKMIHARRVFSLGKEHKFILTKEDLKNTIEYIKKNTKTEDTGPPPGLYI